MSAWRTPPAPIPESEIKATYEADVVVVGLGYAGTAAVRAAAECGVKAIGIEIMNEEKYVSYGRDIGHINSKFLASRGVLKVDPIDFFNEWMHRAGNRANPSLIMKFAQKSGENFDWFTDMYDIDELSDVHVAFWPCGKKFDGLLGGYNFWNGTAQFTDPNPMGWQGPHSLPELVKANFKRARESGAELFFEIEAVQPVMDGRRVAGIIGKDRAGNYYKYMAQNGVVLAAGDFSGNKEMLTDLVPDIVDLFTDGETWNRGGGRNGRGHQIGVWAGGKLEPRSLPTMGGNHNTLNGFNASFGVLWLNTEGKRYCNETFGDPVFAGFPGNQMKRGTFYNIYDSDIMEDLQWAVPAHGGFDEHNERNVIALKDAMKKAVDAGPGGYQTEEHGRKTSIYAGNTPEELADNAGLAGALRENFIASIKRYNEICGKGRDDDFGKDQKLLRPLDKAPLFMQTCAFTPGFMLVSVGGLLTDENQNVLDNNHEKVPGLYATGNCCGRRYGTQYSTPIAGVSIGISIVLGREAGIAAATL